MTPIVRETTKYIKSKDKLIKKVISMMLIEQGDNCWVETTKFTEAEYHRLRKLHGYEK